MTDDELIEAAKDLISHDPMWTYDNGNAWEQRRNRWLKAYQERQEGE